MNFFKLALFWGLIKLSESTEIFIFDLRNNTEYCASNQICVRKCCPKDNVIINRTCSFSNIYDFRPKAFHGMLESNKITNFNVISANFCNNNEKRARVSRQEVFYLQEDGSLLRYFNKTLTKKTVPWNKYCLEQFVKGNVSEFVAVVCIKCMEILQRTGKYHVCMIISMPFLLATFLVYAALPDRNVHQRALMFYVLTLFLSYVLLVTINLTEDLEAPACEILAYFTLFFFMVSFFWMNVICFDIYYTFSGGRGFIGSKRASERRRFLVYSLYAWGLPLIHIVIVYLLQTFLDPNSDHNPRIGDGKCFLADGWPNLWYFYGEAAILILVNIVFFLVTAYKIRQVKKETSMLKQNDSKRHTYEKDKQRFNLFLKLLLAMGVNWSMEVISWAVNWQTSDQYYQVWYVTDFFNAMYGVFIFFIFVFKKKIWKLLQKRYYNLVGKPHLARSMTTTQTRTSHYSSGNYSTADTTLSDRTNINNGARPEEMALRRV